MRDLTPVCLNTLIYLSGEGFLLFPTSFNVTQINEGMKKYTVV